MSARMPSATRFMLSDRGRDALLGILENAEAAQDFVSGMSFDTFAVDRRSVYAVTRCLEIISEASRRVDPETQLRHPHLPWRQIADAGNVYRHRYKSVSALMIWRVVQGRMADLVAMCRAELDASQNEP
ncbi:DUF86 domain-containing protein [Methylobacterium sp. J-072]|uniref:HepT-like ribonuclease domain-containing protein n=1 Tax=Methylobacterium sp. J-072 TaxID=2836651 RepID=UPI001FB98DE0|nr:HepT-like ribonuclease domain-containing protein [Methylobacterium sp. J-072]MCJ2092536.1 DUF86 domain-containing protein [Methylobacterium sp. J-072]